jgi:[ribosomal protein S5]-alanine N-acetyltransferase
MPESAQSTLISPIFNEMATTVTHLENDKVTISTTRLVLRAAEAGDEEYLNEAFSDPEVMRYWSEQPHKSIERTREWITKMTQGQQNGKTDFIITIKPELKPIGKIGVWQDEEIGFLLSRQHWGKGLAQEAIRSMLPYLFEEKGLKQLTADIDPRNEASRRLLAKMGFEDYDFKEKTMEIAGEWVDSAYLKLTRERWMETDKER